MSDVLEQFMSKFSTDELTIDHHEAYIDAEACRHLLDKGITFNPKRGDLKSVLLANERQLALIEDELSRRGVTLEYNGGDK